jgi:hypothetical protein
MARANYFRNNAETCSINARLASEPPERALWLRRAQRWWQLANEAETKADDEPLTPDGRAAAPVRSARADSRSGDAHHCDPLIPEQSIRHPTASQ